MNRNRIGHKITQLLSRNVFIVEMFSALMNSQKVLEIE
jgi:hypothetical protein